MIFSLLILLLEMGIEKKLLGLQDEMQVYIAAVKPTV